jgi:hypothetical protein
MASGRRLVVAMLVLLVCDVIGGFLAVASGVNTWGEAWGFDTTFTVPLPVGAAQLVLAWLAGGAGASGLNVSLKPPNPKIPSSSVKRPG